MISRQYLLAGVIVLVAVILLIAWHADKASAEPSVVWSKQLGVPEGNDETRVVLDTQGNVYLTGVTDGDLFSPNLGAGDAFVVKYDTSGEEQWSMQFGTEEADRLASAVFDTGGNLCVVGWTNGIMYGTTDGSGDVIVAKISSSGDLLWGKQFGSDTTDQAGGVALDSQGNIYVVGSTSGEMFGTGKTNTSTEPFLVKCDSAGNQLWGKQIRCSHTGKAAAVAVDSQGNAYVVGTAAGLFETEPSEEDADSSCFIIKYDSDGTKVWDRQFGTDNDDEAATIKINTTNNAIYVGGKLDIHLIDEDTENADMKLNGFVARYDSDGGQQWLKQLATTDFEEVYSLALDSAGRAYAVGGATGDLFGPTSGQEDAFLVKYDTDGEVAWSHQFGSAGVELATGVAVDSQGRVYVCGLTSGSMYGERSGDGDVFVVKFSPP